MKTIFLRTRPRQQLRHGARLLDSRLQFNHDFVKHTKTTTATSNSHIPVLKEVAMLPYIGSMIPFYSKTPPLNTSKWFEYHPEMRRRFGDFYLMGLPGIGNGIYGEIYTITDPNEMMKVIRQEKGSQVPYPRGALATIWPLTKYFEEVKSPLGTPTSDDPFDADGFMGRGETWKRQRTFMQTDLLSPQAAIGYIPGIVKAAEIASRVASESSKDMDRFLIRSAFDMFCSVMFGELTKTADPANATQENIIFCDNAKGALASMSKQSLAETELILHRGLGIKTTEYRKFKNMFDSASAIADEKYKRFRSKYELTPEQLTDMERNSYLARAIERQRMEGSNISEAELASIIHTMLMAGVDTTSSAVAWVILHLSLNPHVQDKLYEEMSATVASEGCINENVLKRSTSPYLHAVFREAHRISPVMTTGVPKDNPFEDVEIHGVVIPKGSCFQLDIYSVGIDPEFLEDPISFRPERWLDFAVEARKGTAAEILDHPLYRDPFSSGSRKCPGSRVAANEMLVFVTQLVLDWKLSFPRGIQKWDDVKYDLDIFVCPRLPEIEFSKRKV